MIAAGTRLGPYEVLGLIGAGGMGEVYRAKDALLEREVAVKVLLTGYDVAPDGRFAMIRSERQASSPVNVVLNCFEQLKLRVPAEKN